MGRRKRLFVIQLFELCLLRDYSMSISFVNTTGACWSLSFVACRFRLLCCCVSSQLPTRVRRTSFLKFPTQHRPALFRGTRFSRARLILIFAKIEIMLPRGSQILQDASAKRYRLQHIIASSPYHTSHIHNPLQACNPAH